MRLSSLQASGFRGFSSEMRIDLDADAVVVVAANGSGKTSLFDAILWALCGRVPRLGEDRHAISMYAPSGQARVELAIKMGSDECVVTRSADGERSRVVLQADNRTYEGAAADGRLLEMLWPPASAAADGMAALATVLTRNVYLQQDLIRHFVEAATDQDRFGAVSELLGAGRIGELQSVLEVAKRAWTRATNEMRGVAEDLRARLQRLQSSVSLVSEHDVVMAASVEDELHVWLTLVFREAYGPTVRDDEQRARAVSIDVALKQLNAAKAAWERKLESLRGVLRDLDTMNEEAVSDVDVLKSRMVASAAVRDGLRRQIESEQRRLADGRAARAMLKEKSEQLRLLASLAIQNLGDTCPVCTQYFDRGITERHLQELMHSTQDSESDEDQYLRRLFADLANAERNASDDEAAVRVATAHRAAIQSREEALYSRLHELAIDAAQGPRVALSAAVAEAERQIQILTALARDGEVLAFKQAVVASASRTEETQREVAQIETELRSLDDQLSARDETGEQARQVIECLREAISGVVGARLQQMTPLLQSIYSRVDPHPSFRAVSFISRVVRGRGEMSAVVRDPVQDKQPTRPDVVLSSSQMNALAVCVFLTLNLGTSKPALETAMLDDPLQSLDDVNLLGIVDLLRRTKDLRQLIVSTHDRRFGDLLARKLRPVHPDGRTIVVELGGWNRNGPQIDCWNVAPDAGPLRLVAS